MLAWNEKFINEYDEKFDDLKLFHKKYLSKIENLDYKEFNDEGSRLIKYYKDPLVREIVYAIMKNVLNFEKALKEKK